MSLSPENNFGQRINHKLVMDALALSGNLKAIVGKYVGARRAKKVTFGIAQKKIILMSFRKNSPLFGLGEVG